MIYSSNKGEINTNLAGDSYQKLTNGIWKLGLINDNPGIDDKESSFYQDFNHNKGNEDVKGRCFKNKVNVVLADNSTITAHIIHWVKSDGYFCITIDNFWDQFD
jgi:hypothetical protein